MYIRTVSKSHPNGKSHTIPNARFYRPFVAPRPVYSGKVCAGQSRFPSPAQDYEQKTLDLNQRFVNNPPATFFFEVTSDSMIGAEIFPGATLIVNRSVKPKSSSVVIVDVEGEWMVKRLYKRGGTVRLLSDNPTYAPIDFTEGQKIKDTVYQWTGLPICVGMGHTKTLAKLANLDFTRFTRRFSDSNL